MAQNFKSESMYCAFPAAASLSKWKTKNEMVEKIDGNFFVLQMSYYNVSKAGWNTQNSCMNRKYHGPIYAPLMVA